MITIKFFLAGTVFVVCCTLAITVAVHALRFLRHKNEMFKIEKELRIEELRNAQLQKARPQQDVR